MDRPGSGGVGGFARSLHLRKAPCKTPTQLKVSTN